MKRRRHDTAVLLVRVSLGKEERPLSKHKFKPLEAWLLEYVAVRDECVSQKSCV